MKIFVSDFDNSTTSTKLVMLFEQFGEVTAVRRRMGRKRAYAIVEMPDEFQAECAIRELDGREFDGKRLEVSESQW